MKSDPKNNFNHPAVTVTVLILVFLGGYLLVTRDSDTKKDNTSNSQQFEIDALKKTVEDLKSQKPQTIIKEVPAPKSKDITDIISEWGPVVPIIVCNFRDVGGAILLSSEGSAILFQSSGGTFKVLTNQHVVSNGTSLANDCQIQFPNDPQVFTASAIGTAPNGADAAQVRIDNPDGYIRGLIASSKKRFCLSAPSLGDEVVILGYPAIGASSGVTATNGIVSGYDGDYYITSAKVDHGNSGGAAIDVKNDCDLGIPTYVVSGQLESLARILKWQVTAPGASQQSAASDPL